MKLRRVSSWKIFGVGFGLNLIWESLHRSLYADYLGEPSSPLVLLAAVICDGLIITGLYLLALKFKFNKNLFIIISSLLAAILIEVFATKTGWWSYGPAMPIVPILGIGLSPLLQLAITGFFSLQIIKIKN